MTDASITRWIQGLRGGDEDAAAQIWGRFFERLCGLAQRRLGDAPRAASDAEDVALSALNALCAGARADRFRQLNDRDDLWGLLAMLTARKAIDARRRSRTPGTVAWTDALAGGWSDDALAGADDGYLDTLCVMSRELLGRLDARLQEVALLRLEGYTNDEIAERTDRSRPTVERQLRMIRHRWQD